MGRRLQGPSRPSVERRAAGNRSAGAGGSRTGSAGRAGQYAETGSSAVVRLRADLPDMARRTGRLHGVRLQRKRSNMAHGERPEPDRGSCGRLVPAVVRIVGRSGWASDQRWVCGGASRVRRRPRGGRQPGSPGRLHEQPEPQRAGAGGPHRGHYAGSDQGAPERHVRPDRSGRGCGSHRCGPSGGVYADRRLRQRRHADPWRRRPAASPGGHLRRRAAVADERAGRDGSGDGRSRPSLGLLDAAATAAGSHCSSPTLPSLRKPVVGAD